MSIEERHPGPRLSTEARSGWVSRAAEEVQRLDLAIYSAIAATPTPTVDQALRRLSRAANYSRISIASAAILAITRGRRGFDAGAMGLASVAVTSAALNLGLKPLVHRRRPDRVAEQVPFPRQVQMPSSTSFPSGHSAAAFAFATGAAQVLPSAGFPLRAVGALVAYSRVHTGVHYPSDVIVGALLGGALAQVTTYVLQRRGSEAKTNRRP